MTYDDAIKIVMDTAAYGAAIKAGHYAKRPEHSHSDMQRAMTMINEFYETFRDDTEDEENEE